MKSDATTSSTTNGLNELATVNGAAVSYDANGNLTSDPSSAWTFGYDIENELTSAAGAGKSVTLSYDPLGALWKIGGSGICDVGFVTDPTEGGEIAADYAPSTGALNHRYVFGPAVDEPIVEYDASGNRTWLVADERGSIVARADSSGNAGQIDSYDEYGVPASTNGGRYQYTGQAALYEIGLDFYKARIYSPALGRFLQTDPIGYADDPNLYAYVHNDPVNSSDPFGLANQDTGALASTYVNCIDNCGTDIVINGLALGAFFLSNQPMDTRRNTNPNERNDANGEQNRHRDNHQKPPCGEGSGGAVAKYAEKASDALSVAAAASAIAGLEPVALGLEAGSVFASAVEAGAQLRAGDRTGAAITAVGALGGVGAAHFAGTLGGKALTAIEGRTQATGQAIVGNVVQTTTNAVGQTVYCPR